MVEQLNITQPQHIIQQVVQQASQDSRPGRILLKTGQRSFQQVHRELISCARCRWGRSSSQCIPHRALAVLKISLYGMWAALQARTCSMVPQSGTSVTGRNRPGHMLDELCHRHGARRQLHLWKWWRLVRYKHQVMMRFRDWSHCGHHSTIPTASGSSSVKQTTKKADGNA